MVKRATAIKIICRLVLFLALLSTFIGFYFIDQMDAFLKKRSTISTRFEEQEFAEFLPTTTICPSYGQKPSIARNLGLSLNYDILGYGMSEETFKKTNETLLEVFENASYILNRDFNITFSPISQPSNNFLPLSITEGRNEYRINAHKSLVAEVQKIRTMQYATCYKIEPNVTNGAKIPFHMHLNVTQFVNEEDQNEGFYLLLTGNNTWTGITRRVLV